MPFISTFFLFGILPWFLLVLYLCRKERKLQLFFIGAWNLVFYLWGGLLPTCIFALVVVLTWFLSRLCQVYHNRLTLLLGCGVLAFPLAFMKYSSFFAETVNRVLNSGFSVGSMIVPLGISFFTFEAISFLCDIYTGKVVGQVKLIDLYLYLSFFPTITSGPILRFLDFKNDLDAPMSYQKVPIYTERILMGLGKKILIADKVGFIADYYFNGVSSGINFSGLGLWIGAIAYALQLYFDFSGYSDIAIGVGGMLGFQIPENFQKPYCAKSIQDFWRRWHITLSRWFRDYVYIPLGGNRCGKWKQIRNLLVVWLLTGLWHGANWTFIVWGLGYFILLMLEKYVPVIGNIGKHWYGHLYTLFFVILLWVPFRASSLGAAAHYIRGMFSVSNLMHPIEAAGLGFVPFVCISLVMCLCGDKVKGFVEKWRIWPLIKTIGYVAILLLVICAMVNSSYAPSIYGSF